MNYKPSALEITGRGPVIEAVVEASFGRPIALKEAEDLFGADVIAKQFGPSAPGAQFNVNWRTSDGVGWVGTVSLAP
jgi:hypothetical protein